MRKKNTELLSDVIRQVLKEQHLDKPLYEKRLIDAALMSHKSNTFIDKMCCFDNLLSLNKTKLLVLQ